MASLRCGARTRHNGRCLQAPVPGRRRCFRHGGRSWPGNHRRRIGPARIKMELRRALRRAQGLPWYGGALPKRETVDRMVEKAIDIAHGGLEVLETMVPLEAEAEHAGELLLQGMQHGLMVGEDICQSYLELRRTRSFEEMDVKLIRLASDTAGWLTRLGSKVMTEVFQRRRDDTVGKLLEQLRVAESEPAAKDQATSAKNSNPPLIADSAPPRK